MTIEIRQSDSSVTPTVRETVAFGERLTCSVAEACKAVGLSRSKIYELISGGEVQSITIGRRRLVSVPSLKRLTEVETTSSNSSTYVASP
jgi:excisionase family DNA binding protein